MMLKSTDRKENRMKRTKRILLVLLLLLVPLCLSGCGRKDGNGPDSGKVFRKSAVFGRYEQDNNLNNGKEPIEWIVLDMQGGKYLLVSRYGLDVRPYNKDGGKSTWRDCSLRKWLNGDFLNNAFTLDEQNAIEVTHVDNISADSSGRVYTDDKVFLLSNAEAGSYRFTDDEARMCAPTNYAIAQGAEASFIFGTDGQSSGCWWLRTPMMFVDYDGFRSGDTGNTVSHAVRPALWVDGSALGN